MTAFNLNWGTYIKLFKINIVHLNIIDILIFSVFVNLNYFDSVPEILRLLIAIFIIRKSLMSNIYTRFLENIIFISGTKIKKLVLLNFGINNLFFLTIAALLFFLKLSFLGVIVKNLFILNALICISFLLTFVMPFQEIKKPLFRSSVSVLSYYLLFSFLSVGMIYPLISLCLILGIFFLFIHYFNRTLCYDDFN